MKKRGREGEQAQLMMTQRNTEVGGWEEWMIKKVGGKRQKEEGQWGERGSKDGGNHPVILKSSKNTKTKQTQLQMTYVTKSMHCFIKLRPKFAFPLKTVSRVGLALKEMYFGTFETSIKLSPGSVNKSSDMKRQQRARQIEDKVTEQSASFFALSPATKKRTGSDLAVTFNARRSSLTLKKRVVQSF